MLLEQASVTCVSAKRLRNQASLSGALESAKLNATVSNNVSHGWERASNLRIQQKGKHYYAVVRLQEKNESAKGCRTFSKGHASIQAAEEQVAFDFRDSIESATAKQTVKEWLCSTMSLFEDSANEIGAGCDARSHFSVCRLSSLVHLILPKFAWIICQFQQLLDEFRPFPELGRVNCTCLTHRQNHKP
jgi:hypothetical protein